MEKYYELRDRLTKIEIVLNDNKVVFSQFNMKDVIDYRIFDAIMERYDWMSFEVNELLQLVEKTLLCKNDVERLDFFLKNIYRPEQVAEDEIK